MNKINWKALLPHFIAVALFLALALFYNSALLDGNRLVSHDDTMYRGAAKEIIDYRNAEGEEALWTNNMFSGMPAYTISHQQKNNFIGRIFYTFSKTIPIPASHMFLAMLCFYIMLCTFGFKPYAAIIGAISYGFCSYNLGIIVAGHYAKMWAIAVFPLIIAGINMVFKKQYLWGAVVTVVAMNIEVMVNHPQMTYYYFVFFLSLFLLYLFINAIIKKEIKHAIISSAIIMGALGLGVMGNSNKLLITQEYTQYSTRGKSDLTQTFSSADKTDGLDRSYIVGYSSGKDDIYSFLVPNYKGSNSGVQLISNKVAKEAMGKDAQLVGQTEGLVYQNYGEIIETYWGGTDLAGAGIYCSVLIFALFLLSFLFIKDPIKWIIIPAFLITLFLSWGKNYMGFSNFFIDNFPMYNKFRAVNSIIIVITFCIPLMASFMIARLANEPEYLEKKSLGKYKIKHALVGGLGAICLILLAMYAMPTAFQSFFKPAHMVDKLGQIMTEKEIISQALGTQKVDDATINSVINSIEAGRIAIFKADVLRSLIVMLLGTIAIALYAFKVYNWKIMLALVGAIILVDVWQYGQGILSKNTIGGGGEKIFQMPKSAEKKFSPTVADNMILQDISIHKRVLNLAVSPFNDGTTSYFHQSLGGYSGAKLKKYQELVEKGIYPDINRVFGGKTDKIDSLLSTAGVLNMLNTKYFIFDPNSAPLPNRFANGAAWTVADVQFVENSDAELVGLKNINTKTQALVDDDFKADINTTNIRPDSTASITIKQLTPKYIEYEYNSTEDQLAVFSEIYYPAGWKATIDGSDAKIIKVNYVLRGLSVPKGKHKIEFSFEPSSYKKGELLSLISSIILLLLVAGAAFLSFKKYKK